jgi:anti-sigma regulatory factor (Ser/Thr protein kinase)
MPVGWWDPPSAVGCSLSGGLQSAREARRLTRDTLRAWDLAGLADDAEIIVGELAANAVAHAGSREGHRELSQGARLRLLRRSGEVICAVLDPSDEAPVLRTPASREETGRGLQMVEALSDMWGWTPLVGRGKAVWAILFCTSPGERQQNA